jgi:hypothetical protein
VVGPDDDLFVLLLDHVFVQVVAADDIVALLFLIDIVALLFLNDIVALLFLSCQGGYGSSGVPRPARLLSEARRLARRPTQARAPLE